MHKGADEVAPTARRRNVSGTQQYDDRKKQEAEEIFRLSADNVSEKEAEDCARGTEKKISRLEAAVPPPLLKLWEDIKILYGLLHDYLAGRYTDVPWKVIAAVVGALLYFVSPVDAIPDFIPGAGYLDDAGVLVLCLKMIEDDLGKYRLWRKKQ